MCGPGGDNDIRKVSLGITFHDSQNLHFISGEEAVDGTDHPDGAHNTETRARKGRVGSPLSVAAKMMQAPLSCA